MKNIGQYKEALSVCQEGIEKYPYVQILRSLEGNIKLAIDPEYINPERIEDLKKGILANVNDDVLKSLIKTTKYKPKYK